MGIKYLYVEIRLVLAPIEFLATRLGAKKQSTRGAATDSPPGAASTARADRWPHGASKWRWAP